MIVYDVNFHCACKFIWVHYKFVLYLKIILFAAQGNEVGKIEMLNRIKHEVKLPCFTENIQPALKFMSSMYKELKGITDDIG